MATQAYLAPNYSYYNRSYDVMGRVSASSEDVPCGSNCGSNCGSTTHPQYFCNSVYFCYPMNDSYNLASDVTAFTFPSGRVQKTAYDSANRIANVQDTYNSTTSTHASSIGYAPNGAIDSMAVGHATFSGNAMTENITFNTLWQITNRNLQIGSAFPLTLGFTYGAAAKNNGNLTKETIVTTAAPNPPPGVSIPALNLTQTYAYDPYDRLLTATETGGTSDWAQTYLYDQFGNRAVQQSGSYIPNLNGTPTATSQFTNNRWTSASYDAAGDETTVPGSTSESLVYDGEYRAQTATVNGSIVYSYDGEGRRVQKTSSTFQVSYVYDASGKEIMESTIPLGNSPVEAPFTGTEYLIADHLGSSRMAINTQGQVVRRYDFLPFGEELKAWIGGRGADYEPSTYLYPTTPDDVTRKFTGKDRDSETGLDYFGARYMSSAQGRFTSPDPKMFPHDLTDPQSWNKYAYTRNNPLRYTDPDGEDFWDAVKGTINAFTSDNAFGAGRINSGNSDFRTGQAVGDAIATVTGTAEVLFGGGEAIVTSPAVLTVAGAVIPAAGAATAVHGSTTAAIAGSNLAAAAFADNNQQSSGEGSQLVGNNPRDAKGRTNTDLPGGHEAAKDTFGKLTSGQDVAVDPKTGHQVAADGTRLRLNSDGTARVDVPSSQTNPKRETVHFNNADKPQQ